MGILLPDQSLDFRLQASDSHAAEKGDKSIQRGGQRRESCLRKSPFPYRWENAPQPINHPRALVSFSARRRFANRFGLERPSRLFRIARQTRYSVATLSLGGGALASDLQHAIGHLRGVRASLLSDGGAEAFIKKRRQ